MIQDVIDRIGTILSDPDVSLDDSGKEPATYEPGTLYVFPDADAQIVGAESGPPSREDFNVRAVYMASDRGEEARQERTGEVTAVLLSRRDAYVDRLQQRETCDLWAHIGVSTDEDWTSNFEGRAVSVLIQGYRYL